MAGKGIRILIAAIIDWAGPLITTSTRSDNLTTTMRARQAKGTVSVFDPQGLSGIQGAMRTDPTASGSAAEARAAARAADASFARQVGILREANAGRGMFGLQGATRAEAEMLGKEWVGPGAKLASDGKTWVSSNGLRQWRPPSYKPSRDEWQSNFESRDVPSGRWINNGHLNITDGQ
ncbi:hypothetical protein [Curtobacterium sp. Curtsp57]|uniref:hypothetical protein n=1 Tax=Curtobacterium sp. Curtsp57 TaxID=3243047 RepID=UPI0039B5CBA2